MKKLFAAVSPDGHFEFDSIQQKRCDVLVLADEAKYDSVRAEPVVLSRYRDDLLVEDASTEAAPPQQLAWILLNEDESYSLGTLALTLEESRARATLVFTGALKNFRLVPVRLMAEKLSSSMPLC
jgi:hypothetical protein